MIGLSWVNSASNSASEAVRVLGVGLQAHEVDDVDDADLEFREVLAQERDRRQRFQRRHVAAQPITTSGSPPSSLLAQSQMPTPRVQWMIGVSMDRYLQRRLLAGNDHVDVVAARRQ